MATNGFRALVVDKDEQGISATLRTLPQDALPPGDVTVRVAYSTLNYKDGLAVSGSSSVVRNFPMVPGVDFSGTVVESSSPDFKPGQPVLLTGWGVGERHWGGYSQLARVKAEWLLPLPEGLTLKQAMGIGTAGFTAMLCVMTLEKHGLTPDSAAGREVAVTGASGGVGSVAVPLLARRGYNVTAITGREDLHGYLRELGASQVVGRDALPVGSGRPLESQRWFAAVDVVGGTILDALLRQVHYGGAVAACGLAGGSALNTTVFPFILRGVSLLGVDSVMCPQTRRKEAWSRLVADLPTETLERITHTITLSEVPAEAKAILAGKVQGRLIVDVNA